MRINTTLEKLNEGIETIRKNGGRVGIDGSSGSVSIQGVIASFDFDQESGVLNVRIMDKPWLASEGMIEDKIQEFFG